MGYRDESSRQASPRIALGREQVRNRGKRKLRVPGRDRLDSLVNPRSVQSGVAAAGTNSTSSPCSASRPPSAAANAGRCAPLTQL